jgi:hypothetical protein
MSGLSHFTRSCLCIVAAAACWTRASAEPPRITHYHLQSPGPTGYEVAQASDLTWGKLAGRDGLWTACDRNGDRSGGRIYRVSPATLASAPPGGTIVADEEIVIAAPAEGWRAFRDAQRQLGDKVLDHIQERIIAGVGEASGKLLDLEAITIGTSPLPPHEPRLFVVAEEPYSLVLELRLGKPGQPTRAELVAAYRYHEREDEHGTDFNDGVEGLAYAGSPGKFWWAEEGTRLTKPGANPRLFFSDPRLGLGELKDHTLVPTEPVSASLTNAVRRHKSGESQTLNALFVAPGGNLLAVDRNGGWVLQVDSKARVVSRWFNLYDIGGTNLRKVLADFPGRRVMPYISIEGIALDEAGNVWLVDDPAMPEPFRASCLIRIAGLPPPGPTGSTSAPN